MGGGACTMVNTALVRLRLLAGKFALRLPNSHKERHIFKTKIPE